MATIEETIRTIIREELAAAKNVTAIAPEGTAVAATPKPRGRPAKGEAAASAAPAASTAAVEADPFDSPAPVTATVPTVTEDEVRAALNALKEAVSQDKALAVLNAAGGATNLSDLRKTPEKFALVVAAAKAAMPAVTASTVEADPFETASEPVKQPTLEEVKAACVAGGKRASQEKVLKIVMDHGGKGKNAATGAEGPSLNALSADKYAAVIAAVAALPTTK